MTAAFGPNFATSVPNSGLIPMQPITSLVLLLFLCGIPCSRSAAQHTFMCRDVVSSAGAYASGADKHFEFTIGEPVIQSLGNSFVSLSQGFTQPEVCPLVLVDNHEPVRIHDLILYPNPVDAVLHLRLDEAQFPEIQFELFDAAGRQVGHTPFVRSNGELSLDCTALGSGAYFLVILSGDSRPIFTVPFIRQGH